MKRLLILCFAALAIASCGKGLDRVDPDDGSGQDETIRPDECTMLSFSLSSSANGFDLPEPFMLSADGSSFSAKHLKWIEKSEPAMLIPEFQFRGKTVSVGGTEVVSGKTVLDFSHDFMLTVTAEDGTAREYVISLNCPQINGELAVLRLQPESPIVSKTEYVKARATLYSPNTQEGWWGPDDEMIEVRGRGNSTWTLPKKPYRIKFPAKFSPVGLNHAKEKSWVLIANDMDKSLIRDALGWTMSRILFNKADNYHDPLALTFTPCTEFVNLYMGDYFHGVYLLTDQMQRAGGRIEVEKLTASNGSDPEAMKGGHIIEVDIHNEAAPIRFRSGVRKIKMDHKYPEDDDFTPEQYKYIEDYITAAEEVLYGSDYKDPEKGWRRYFDEKTLIDYIIVKELCGDMDGYTSTYFYKRRGSDKLFFGPVWDVDKGWDNEIRTAGSTSDKANRLMIHAGFQMPGANGADWFNRFWTDETLRAAVNARWKEKRNELVDAVKAQADALSSAMPKAVEANFSVWPFYYQACADAKLPASSYSLEIDRIKRLTDQRALALDREFAK